VSRPVYAVNMCSDCYDKKLKGIAEIDYDRIGERMYVEALYLKYEGDAAAYVELAKKAVSAKRTIILACPDAAAAKQAVDAIKDQKPLLAGADKSNYKELSAIAQAAGIALCVGGANIDEAYDLVAELEKAGNKELVVDVTAGNLKETFAAAVQLRRAAIKGGDHTAGYPSLVRVGDLFPGDRLQQLAAASLFTLKYGSIIVLEDMDYAQALPLFGARQNIYTDPQKPMTFEPKLYPINGADENAVCAVTVDFALSVFMVQGELERSGVPVNFFVSDAGGYSVLTSWAAGKFSASSIAKFLKEGGYLDKQKNKTLIIPGKVAVLKGELEEQLPGWKILVGPKEAVGIVKFLKEL
jgi:acetyl-CoA decarbonylase/synthase complex subunit gamma